MASSSSGVPSGEVTYQYDARTRRTRKTNAAGATDYYYDKQWRAIEERVGGTVTAEYVWSPLDRWTMIRRKRGSEELYVLKDHLDPAAIIDSDADVVERFGYDAFGPVRFMDASFAPRSTSAAAWNYLYHAEFLDEDTGLYNYGYRYLHPQLGRWLSRDPIGEEGGINLYELINHDTYDKSNPLLARSHRPVRSPGTPIAPYPPGVVQPLRIWPGQPPSRPKRKRVDPPPPPPPPQPRPYRGDPRWRFVEQEYIDRNGQSSTQLDPQPTAFQNALLLARKRTRFRYDCCRMTEALPRGGDPFHNAYAASLGLVEVRVDINDTPPCPPFTGGKRSKQFDGSVGPPIVLIDVKTRMGGLRFPRVHSDVYHSKAVADYCGAGFLIAIENKESAEVWRENFPDNINISHVPWGGDFP